MRHSVRATGCCPTTCRGLLDGARAGTVHRIDETVAGELAGQGFDGELPCEALRRMPYPIIYVDSRVPVSYPSGIRAAHGFFAYIDRDFTGEIDLALIYIMEDGSRSRLSLIVEDGTTLASCLDHVKKPFDMAMAEMSGGEHRPSAR